MSENYLTAAMDNVLAYQLGLIARSPQLHDPINIGDEIDRGLILRRLLEERGFGLVRLTQRAADVGESEPKCTTEKLCPVHNVWHAKSPRG